MKTGKRQYDEKLVHDYITDAALELLFGGQVTLSCVMTCAMMLLKQNPQALQKLRDDVDHNGYSPAHHNVHDVHYSVTDEKYLDNFPYVDNVTKEVLRLFPPVGGGFRKAKMGFEISVSLQKCTNFVI